MERVRRLSFPPGTPHEDVAAVVAAVKGEDGARDKVRALLVRDPAWVERIGSLAAVAEDAVVAQADAHVLVQESARAELARMRESLLLPSDGPLERMLVHRVALCWLNLTVAETQRAIRVRQKGATEATSHWDRRVTRLNGDFLRASKTLALVRRSRRATVQVNVARQQVNFTR